MYTRLKKRVKIEVSEQPDPIKIKLSKTQEQKPLNNQSLTSVDKEVLELLEADDLNKSSAADQEDDGQGGLQQVTSSQLDLEMIPKSDFNKTFNLKATKDVL